MTLQVVMRKALRAFTLDVALTIPPGVTVLTGPSGAGKTTILRAIAGLDWIDTGRIALGERVLDDGVHRVVPARRNVALVFQEFALFPHLSVAANVGYGLVARRVGVSERRRRVAHILERLRIAELSDALPSTISGGERQRVALARALVLEPDALLLDEPLAALDRDTRDHVRSELHEVLAASAIPTLLVSHDERDEGLWPTVVRLREGRVV